MLQRFASPSNQKAWLYHRGKWFSIDDPLFRKDRPTVRAGGIRRQMRRRSFDGYQLTQWRLGPTFLGPNYSGLLVYVYIHQEIRKARYLILIEAPQTSEILYAQDLPDTFDLLHWLAPIVNNTILVDVYQRGINTFSRNRQTI